MKKRTFDTFASPSRLRLIQALMALLFLCVLFMSFEIPVLVFRTGFGSVFQTRPRTFLFVNEDEFADKDAPIRPTIPTRVSSKSRNRTVQFDAVSGLIFNETVFDSLRKDEFSELHKSAKQAWVMGKKIWDELKLEKWKLSPKTIVETPKNHSQSCPHSISLSGPKFWESGGIMVIPCGLTLGSHITLVGRPHWAHSEQDPKKLIVKDDGQSEIVSQFMMELQGLKVVDGEDPPRILHFNPRLKGDWSRKPVIEQNTCYRMQWGSALRCEGWNSKAEEETVDGLVKCEKWIRDDDERSVESKTTWWLKRLMGRTNKAMVDWPFPFAEDKLFVLTLRAGLEGYHVNVDGRHVTSFPYRTGYVLEDATGLAVNGDIDVHSVVAASLPTSHPSFAPQRHLEMLEKWQAPGRPDGPVELFIGILSAGNHFGERMGVRKSWMQHRLIKSSQVVARFFVALHEKEEVNVELKKEADYFGDMVIVPYMDNYDLVVLKTVAICEYGARTVVSKYIMKCDDDTFVRVDAVIEEAKKIEGDTDIYVGNMNYNHKPLRHGKWTVTYEEWPEEEYPPYANGPGYIVSYDIAQFIVSQFEKHKLRLFKMEDVSMGMWVEQFNSSRPVEYLHSAKFCQFGCIDDYYTAHYQSPRQMICLWDKLQQQGKPQCCNMR